MPTVGVDDGTWRKLGTWIKFNQILCCPTLLKMCLDCSFFSWRKKYSTKGSWLISYSFVKYCMWIVCLQFVIFYVALQTVIWYCIKMDEKNFITGASVVFSSPNQQICDCFSTPLTQAYVSLGMKWSLTSQKLYLLDNNVIYILGCIKLAYYIKRLNACFAGLGQCEDVRPRHHGAHILSYIGLDTNTVCSSPISHRSPHHDFIQWICRLFTRNIRYSAHAVSDVCWFAHRSFE